jgi:Domain of unknown function (DUF6791)/ThiF family
MSHKLIDPNPDLRRLRDEGYNVDIVGANLVVRDIPYVNEKREVLRDGTLITSLDLNGDLTNRPSDHTIKFAGQCPCTSDGKPIDAIRPHPEITRFSDDLSSQYTFSSKPKRGYYEDYYEKVKTYAAILSGHASTIDRSATAQTYRVVEPEGDDSPFHYLDTASGRADINLVTRKLAAEKLAIIGLGGTGSYCLDLLAKTPAKEIHLYDGDKFSSHNAFRAPGAASKDDLHKQQLKVEYFKDVYSKMHKGIVPHGQHVTSSNIEELRGMACVFLCIDASPGKKYIVEKLEEFGVLFIDTGIGLYVKNETLGGILRVTTSDAANRPRARSRMSFAAEDEPNEYDKNIQIADLNALNAVLAVIRWKKICGFYFDLKHERFNSYTIGSNMLLNEDLYEPN